MNRPQPQVNDLRVLGASEDAQVVDLRLKALAVRGVRNFAVLR